MTDVDALLLFKEITTLALKKDKLRATDYRRAMLKVSKKLLKDDEKDILLLFCEMMGMYSENEEKRSPRSVLRLYNISFRHGQAIQRLLTPPKELTLRKLCGIYYHGAVDHAHCYTGWSAFVPSVLSSLRGTLTGLRISPERPGTSTLKILCPMPSCIFKQKMQWQWRQTV